MSEDKTGLIDKAHWQSMSEEEFTQRVLESADLLEAIISDRGLLVKLPHNLRKRLFTAAGKSSKPDRMSLQLLWKAQRRARQDKQRRVVSADQKLLDQTGIRRQRIRLVYPTPLPGESAGEVKAREETKAPLQLKQGKDCYICKQSYQQVHFFYDRLCPSCAEFNWKKRYQTADLTGRVALITGARVKIGYQAAIMLLRAGVQVIVVTRFPRDAVARYAKEPDFEKWAQRLKIYGLDLRHTPSVEAFTAHVNRTYDRLDFILNNACQTVRRPSGFYQHLMEGELKPIDSLPSYARQVIHDHEQMRTSHNGKSLEVASHQQEGLSNSAALSQLPLLDADSQRGNQLFPAGELDADLQQVDLRKHNSWRLPLAEVSAIELLEVHLVNAVAPFIFNARLKPLMLRYPSNDKHIVNVSAMEGQFYRAAKTDKHPHTNMAKASLNMMTRTSAADYIKDGIHMNSVDTGWITDEDPIELAQRKIRDHGFHPPLDHVDAAARICDPIFSGFLTGKHLWGQFLKDYSPTMW